MSSRPRRLLVDECLATPFLVDQLQRAGHDVVTSREYLGSGATDIEVLTLAKREHRVILTSDCSDFLTLHEGDGGHDGMLFVHYDGDGRDMSWEEIAMAIDRIADCYPDGVAGEIVILNHLRRPRWSST